MIFFTITKNGGFMRLSSKVQELLRELQHSISDSLHNDIKYSVSETFFLKESNTLKIVFQKSEKYRTIDRYVQRNYERYPIYSDWKYKTSKIKKSIKINNQTLEDLRGNGEFLINYFRYSIILSLNREELIPSWAWKDIYNLQEDLESKPYRDLISEKYKSLCEIVRKKESEISENNYLKDNIEKKLVKPLKKRDKILLKIKKTRLKFKLRWLTKKESKVLDKIQSLEKSKSEYVVNIEKLQQEIKFQNSQHNKFIYKQKKEIEKIKDVYNKKRLDIKRLPTSLFENNKDSDFFPIQDISMFNQERITGVYIIKNNENLKYYVGQSKDVLRRLRQHFKENIPQNIIFAEDYYLSKNKDKLFSVKIIPLQTKDELDRTEKMLIEKYDSFNCGYNKTKGND